MNRLTPNYLFEVSWEICNKAGGIHTVIATKSLTLEKKYGDKYILIGPDVWRDSTEHPEFREDPTVLSGWKQKAISEGLRVRVGRWKILGNPIVILVDFTTFFSNKDEIFSKFWELYKLDSIAGQWDYIEPSLFGYASGRVIESVVKYHLTSHDKVVAQFHDWTTGAGLLYLKMSIPQVGTVFTTHGTVVGREIAEHGQPLYSQLDEYDVDSKAAEFHVVSKQSMERACATNADAFTTISDLTSIECNHFLKREIDVVLPNGFEDSFVPSSEEFDAKRNNAREVLLKVAASLFGEPIADDALLIANSGRYEFKNKGIDLFIESLGKLKKDYSGKREIVAFMLIPASHYGPRKDVLEKMKNPDGTVTGDSYLTHNLHYIEQDQIISHIQKFNLSNTTGDKVRIIYVPAYLNGEDGIFNLSYFNLLIGFDLTLFPSYYEPWGYTTLESLAFHIPSLTTSVTGFGRWVIKQFKQPEPGLFVLHRDDYNENELKEGIVTVIKNMSVLSVADMNGAREKAFQISRSALWSDLIERYYDAFNVALREVSGRVPRFVETERVEVLPTMEEYNGRTPVWKKVIVQQNIPDKLKPLEELSRNLWWSWNPNAIELFSDLDPELWEQTQGNPIMVLDKLSYKRFLRLEKDEKFLERMKGVYEEFRAYMASAKYENPEIAYFSMEYGLHESLKIYSGGLGLLAGDYLKEASDSNVNITAIGLLYRYGYFTQALSASGEQVSLNEPQQFSKMPVTPLLDEDGTWKEISIVLPGRDLKARIWRVDVGRVKLYLLDTDFEDNMEQDRSISYQLYGGDNENRFKQEILLGIGGIRALKLMGHEPDLFHCNEGHAAFIGIERLREYIQIQNLTFPEALEIVRASTLFTTHTPVPAGHDYFEEDMMRAYISHYPPRLKITWEHLMNLGKMHPNTSGEKFSMSVLAVNLSQEVNGVSRLHGEVSRKMFADMWKGYLPEEVPIGHVTNGVHLPTWVSRRWRDLYKQHFDTDFCQKQADRSIWGKINDIDQAEIWKIRSAERKELIDYLKKRLKKNSARSNEDPKLILEVQEKLDPHALTICFARRFATYKRAHLLFRDPDRLASIVNNPFMPVQFIFAGKAHPKDKAGQDLIQKIVESSKEERFQGKIIFLENYEIPLAKRLVHGVDVWLNTPTRPLEASGTSGEKAVMNGVLHFSVLDGWWEEGYKNGAGWALQKEKFYDNQNFQDQLDAETIYSLLENEIAPTFYKRDLRGIPMAWVNMIQKSISQIAPEFTMNRMLLDYIQRFYSKMYDRTVKLRENEYELASHIASWKRKILNAWNQIEVVSVQYPDMNKHSITMGSSYHGELVLDLKTLKPDEIGVELIIGDRESENEPYKLISKQEFKVERSEGSKVWYLLETTPTEPGIFDYGIRIYPKNCLLAHRQELNIVRWI